MYFVLRLRKEQYLWQFGQYAWTHMILLVVFIPTSFFVSNIFDGLIWFLLPCALVIINDISAYLVGGPPCARLVYTGSPHMTCPLRTAQALCDLLSSLSLEDSRL